MAGSKCDMFIQKYLISLSSHFQNGHQLLPMENIENFKVCAEDTKLITSHIASNSFIAIIYLCE